MIYVLNTHKNIINKKIIYLQQKIFKYKEYFHKIINTLQKYLDTITQIFLFKC